MLRRTTITVCLLLVTLAAQADAQEELKPEFLKLWSDIEAGKFDDVISVCKANPNDDSLSQAMLGVAYAKLPDFEPAEIHSAKSVELSPNDPTILASRAYVLGAQGRYSEGIEFCHKAIELRPGHHFAKTNLSNLLYFDGQVEEAAKVIDDVLEADSSLAFSWYVKANNEQLFSRKTESTRCRQKAIEINPHYLNAHIMEGYTYLEMQQHDQAIEKANQVIKLNPNSYLGYEFRAYAETLKNESLTEQAKADIEKSIALSPDHFDVYASKADTLMLVEDFEEALKAVDQSIEKHPRPFYATLLRSSVLARLERYDDALEACDRAEAFVPNHFRSHYMRGYVHLWAGDKAKAKLAFDKAQSLFPQYAQIYSSRSFCHDDAEKSIVDLDDAIRLAPHVSWFYRARADLHEEIGNEAMAMKDRKQADELDEEQER